MDGLGVVVADTGPVLNLAYAEHLWLLPALFGTLLIPAGVSEELAGYGVKVEYHPWLVRRDVPEELWRPMVGSRLQIGEAQSIVLALEVRASWILLDERAGRKEAVHSGLRPMGTLGVLAMAKREGVIVACRPVLESCRVGAGAWFGERLAQEFLESVGE